MQCNLQIIPQYVVLHIVCFNLQFCLGVLGRLLAKSVAEGLCRVLPRFGLLQCNLWAPPQDASSLKPALEGCGLGSPAILLKQACDFSDCPSHFRGLHLEPLTFKKAQIMKASSFKRSRTCFNFVLSRPRPASASEVRQPPNASMPRTRKGASGRCPRTGFSHTAFWVSIGFSSGFLTWVCILGMQRAFLEELCLLGYNTKVVVAVVSDNHDIGNAN